MRIGQSTDIHRLVTERPLILGGVKIPHSLGLLGHSDADVLVHAIAEAIIGALGKGDLGTHFPDTALKYQGISSLKILSEVYAMMREQKQVVGNIDALVIIEKPKLIGYIDEMRRNVAEVLHCEKGVVNIKATTGEGLGFVGTEQGAIATAVVLLVEEEDE